MNIRVFWQMLLDLYTKANSNLLAPLEDSILQTPVIKSGQAITRLALQMLKAKKKDTTCSFDQQLLNCICINRTWSLISLPQRELICPNKQKVTVTANLVKNTLSKQICRLNKAID